MTVKIITGDCTEKLKELPSGSVQCVVTSPPYWGLRDYGTASWEGGDPECDHAMIPDGGPKQLTNQGAAGHVHRNCPKCGATRVDDQLGLEPTPDAYVAKLVAVFRELWRVLRDDGCVFLNLGDSYYSSSQYASAYGTSGKELADYQSRDSLCENLCGVCREVYHRRFRIDGLLVPMLVASLSASSLARKAIERDRLPTSDFVLRVDRMLHAIPGFLQRQGRAAELPPDALVSTIHESLQPLLVECWRRGNSSSCLLCGRSLGPDAQDYGYKMACPSAPETISCGIPDQSESRRNTFGTADASASRTLDMDADSCSYLNYTITSHRLKPKDLCGIPWRVAFALQADGWYLRSDIIWAKPNPMPESVTDRPTKSHEYVFLLTKSARYFYDADAVREKSKWVDDEGRPIDSWGRPVQTADHHLAKRRYSAPGLDPIRGVGRGEPQSLGANVTDGKRNRRTVWTIATQPFPGAHFATFPPALVEPCIMAGTSERGCCPVCGSPWERVVERSEGPNQEWAQDTNPTEKEAALIATGKRCGHGKLNRGSKEDYYANAARNITTGWRPGCDCCQVCDHYNLIHDCDCKPYDPIPCTVLDPFAGAGTVGLVADRLGRDAILIELNPDYARMSYNRIIGDNPMFVKVEMV